MSKLFGLKDALDSTDLSSISSNLVLEGSCLARDVIVDDEQINVELRRHDFPEVKTHSYHFRVYSSKHEKGLYRTFCKNSLDKAIRSYQFVMDYFTKGAKVR
ncbi:hypothetical protein H8D36_06855 [archaeon]|nr:hypothetical protein [archaeon]